MPATGNYPWTDRQVEFAYEAAQQTTVGFDLGDIREILRGWSEAGMTVTFPEPRYVAQNLVDYAEVWDQGVAGSDARVAAWFSYRHHPDARRAAREEAARLNRVHVDND